MGLVSDMLDAWVIANFVFFRASFWEEDRRLVIRAFFPLAEGIVELGFGRNIYPCVCVCVGGVLMYSMQKHCVSCMVVQICYSWLLMCAHQMSFYNSLPDLI